MATKKNSKPFNLGDRVKIRHTDWRGRIVELRGPLGPGGAQVYGVRIARKPKSSYIEVREDQLIPIPAEDYPFPGMPEGGERSPLYFAPGSPKQYRCPAVRR